MFISASRLARPRLILRNVVSGASLLEYSFNRAGFKFIFRYSVRHLNKFSPEIKFDVKISEHEAEIEIINKKIGIIKKEIGIIEEEVGKVQSKILSCAHDWKMNADDITDIFDSLKLYHADLTKQKGSLYQRLHDKILLLHDHNQLLRITLLNKEPFGYKDEVHPVEKLQPLKTLRNNYTSASLFSSNNWHNEKILGKYEDCVVQHHRTPAIPAGIKHVSLLHPIFGEFQEMFFKGRSELLGKEESQFTEKFCAQMSAYFECENDRKNTGNTLLQNYLGEEFSRVFRISTDGSIYLSPFSREKRMALINIEYKNELGTGGGDATMQNIGYFLEQLWEFKLDEKYGWRLPIFLVSITGPLVAVYGAVMFAGKLHCDPLTPYHHLILLDEDKQSLYPVGALFRALKTCIPRLRNYYTGLLKSPHPTSVPSFPFPYLDSLPTEDGGTMKLSYIEPLSRRVFLARTDNGLHVIVKFIQDPQNSTAIIDGQRALAGQGFAPALLAHTKLPPTWVVTVSEYIEGGSPYDSTPERDANLIAALTCLHGMSIVHGDLRQNNVITTENTSKVYIIDFELCGLEGVDRYPSFLNHDCIIWPKGAEDAKSLRCKHDLEFAKRLMISSRH